MSDIRQVDDRRQILNAHDTRQTVENRSPLFSEFAAFQRIKVYYYYYYFIIIIFYYYYYYYYKYNFKYIFII